MFVSCGNLDNEKLASIVISFGNTRSEIPYQKSDVSYYIAIITPDPNKEGEVIIDNQKTSHEFAELPSGKYSLNVYAYNEKDILVAEGSDEEIEVNPGETAQAQVTMKLKAYHVHDFAEEWTCDETHHWHAATCEDTDEVQDKAEHDFGEWITVIAATEETGGLRKQTCKICNYEKTEKIPLLNHTHTWATEWSYDENNHWHAATCGDTDEVQDKAEHIFGEWIIVTAATEEEEGLKKQKCEICDYERIEKIPLLNHTHTWASEWIYDESNHWHECTSAKCSETTEHIHHNWDNGTETKGATCTEEGELVYKCEDCGMERREVLPAQGHAWGDYVYNGDATEAKAGTKTRTCLICGEKETLPANGPYTATYKFTETVQPAPAGYSGSMESANKTGRYVKFGDFPQTVAPTINFDINPHAEENGYYVGEDGCYYEKVLENTYQTSYQYSDDSYTRKSTTENPVYRYFKIEPIIWRVINDNDISSDNATEALLLAENALVGGIPYYVSTSVRSIKDTNGTATNIQPYNYEHSTIRAYLNGLSYYKNSSTQDTTYEGSGFLQKAFTPYAVEIINTTNVTNNSVNEGNDTQDKIFILSKVEVNNEGYGFAGGNDNACTRNLTDYGFAMGGTPNWWTRTYGKNGTILVFVSTTGSTAGGQAPNIAYYSIVPALTVPVSELPQ